MGIYDSGDLARITNEYISQFFLCVSWSFGIMRIVSDEDAAIFVGNQPTSEEVGGLTVPELRLIATHLGATDYHQLLAWCFNRSVWLESRVNLSIRILKEIGWTWGSGSPRLTQKLGDWSSS